MFEIGKMTLRRAENCENDVYFRQTVLFSPTDREN